MGKHLEACNFINDSNTGVFMRNLKNFYENLFYRIPTVAASVTIKHLRLLLKKVTHHHTILQRFNIRYRDLTDIFKETR